MDAHRKDDLKSDDPVAITKQTIFYYLRQSQRAYDKLLICQQRMEACELTQKNEDYDYILALNRRMLFCLREYIIPKYSKMMTKYNAFQGLK